MALGRHIRSILDIRKGEVAITVMLASYYYLILVTYYFLKPARDGLFLTKLGKEQLPLVFILTALASIPVTALYARAARSFKLTQLINGTTVVIILNLIALRWLIPLGETWIFYLFYIWVSIYGILVTAQFWLFANAVYDVTQAKRIFLILGSAGIVGAFTGGELTNYLVKSMGIDIPNLLLIGAGALVICIALLHSAWNMHSKSMPANAARPRVHEETHQSFFATVATIRRSRHLMLIVGIIALTMMVSTFTDYQFKALSYDAFKGNEAGLTGFLGKFYGRINIVSLILQLLVGYRLLRLVGVGGIVLFLPIGIALGSVSVLVWPVLLSGIFLKGTDAALEYSVDKTGRELLFLPVPMALKKQTKVFIDLFVDRWFRGIAGGMLLLCTLVLSMTAQTIAIVVLVLVALWLVLALSVRKEYISAFRHALEHREIDLTGLTANIDDPATVQALAQTLKTGNERQILYALGLLQTTGDAKVAHEIEPLLEHDSAEVRRKAIEVLQNHPDAVSPDLVRLHLADDDFAVRRETVHFLYLQASESRVQLLKELLIFPDFRVQSSALSCMAEHRLSESTQLVDKAMIQRVLDRRDDDAAVGRREIAALLGQLADAEFRKYHFELIKDSEPEVVNQAARSAGKLKDRDFVASLIHLLGSRQNRIAAKEALAAYGSSVVGTLRDYLLDEKISLTIRRQIAPVLGLIKVQESVDVLTACAPQVPPDLKFSVVKALNKLRVTTQLKFSEAAIDRVLVEECKSYYEILSVLSLHDKAKTNDRDALLKKALAERLDSNIERIFRLLGLRYPPKDIFNAYLGLKSDMGSQRASAVEFLDNLLPSNLKRYLLPIIDEPSAELTIRKGANLFNIQITQREEALHFLIEGQDLWLKCCAIHTVDSDASPVLRKAIEHLVSDPDRLVQETATLAASRFGGSKLHTV